MKNIDGDDSGITRISTEKLAKFAEIHGRDQVRLVEVDERDRVHDSFVRFHFMDGAVYTASGFTTGYFGEGPRGLYEAIKRYLNRTDITPEIICSWRGKKIYLILRGAGSMIEGGPGNLAMIVHPGSESEMEIW